MANCKYCGKAAGFLRSVHKECQSRFKSGSAELLSTAVATIGSGGDFSELKNTIAGLSAQAFISAAEQQRIIVAAWEQAVERFLNDGVLDQAEEDRLAQYKQFFLLNDLDLDKNGYLTKTAKAGTIRDLLEGKIPERVSITGGVGLNLQKGEQIIWAFPNTEYLEDKTRRHYVGRSSGVSIRVAKGVYYRTGAFQGRPVEYTERVSLGKGLLVLTNKNIYFQGTAKAFRLPYSKVVSFEPYSNGMGIMRDAANAKMQTFINGDGWFLYNVVSNINNI